MLPCFLFLVSVRRKTLLLFPPLFCGFTPLCITLRPVLPVPLSAFLAQRFGVYFTILFLQISGVDRGALRRAAKAALPDELELLAANHAVGSCNRAVGGYFRILHKNYAADLYSFGNGGYRSHCRFSMRFSAAMPGRCLRSSSKRAIALCRSRPSNVSVAVHTVVPSS